MIPEASSSVDAQEISETIQESRREFEGIGKRDMEQALEESMNMFNESEKAIGDREFIEEGIKSSIDEFMSQAEENLILD